MISLKVHGILIFIFSANLFAGTNSICGRKDNRILSYDSKIGRIFSDSTHKSCTVTLISDSCAITAGHCKPDLKFVEFNTPLSKRGRAQASDIVDIYTINENSIQLENKGAGKDWAVFRILPNSITNKLPGQVQGFYDVSYEQPKKGQKINITGYGRDTDSNKSYAQQIDQGKIKSVEELFNQRFLITHSIDTRAGNSGSTIILEEEQEIIGIHTHGGCSSESRANRGTLIYNNSNLINAIKTCLRSEAP